MAAGVWLLNPPRFEFIWGSAGCSWGCFVCKGGPSPSPPMPWWPPGDQAKCSCPTTTPPGLGSAGAAGGISLPTCMGFSCCGWVGGLGDTPPSGRGCWCLVGVCSSLPSLLPPPSAPLSLPPSPSSFLLTLLPYLRIRESPRAALSPPTHLSKDLESSIPLSLCSAWRLVPAPKEIEGVPGQREVALPHQMTSVRRMLEAIASWPSGLIQR